MATAKSLKKLRSASTAFLEDGGSFLHGVDGLLRDIQRTIADLQRREQLLIERETAVASRESRLDGMLQQLAERLATRESDDVSNTDETRPSNTTPISKEEPSNETIAENAESNLSTELTEILAAVDEAVTPTFKPETPKPFAVANTSVRHQNQRKKRRR